MTPELHLAFQDSVGEDASLIAPYIDAMSDDGRYPLFVEAGLNWPTPPSKAWRRNFRWHVRGCRPRMPQELDRKDGPRLWIANCRGKWAALISFSPHRIPQRYRLFGGPEELIRALREGILCPRQRRDIRRYANLGEAQIAAGGQLCLPDEREKFREAIREVDTTELEHFLDERMLEWNYWRVPIETQTEVMNWLSSTAKSESTAAPSR